MKKVLIYLDSLLKSVKFAVVLMLLIGVASIYGTIFPARTPFDFNIYKTVPFIFLLFIFALNIAYCTFFRLVKQTKARYKNIGGGVMLGSFPKESDLLARFREKGFSIEEREEGFYIYRGTFRNKIVLLVHLSLIMLLVSVALSSLTGFLGTANVYVGDRLNLCFDWGEKKDVPLPFEIFVKSAQVLYYPMPIKVLAEDLKTNRRELIKTREEEKIRFDGLSFKVKKADPATGYLEIYYLKDGIERGPYKNLFEDGGRSIKFTLKAYMDPIPKQYVADIVLFQNGVARAEKRISINDPLIYNSYRIYLLNIEKDKYNFDFVGFQITKEPFMSAIWLSCIILCLSLSFYPFIEECRLRVESRGQEFVLYGLPPLPKAREVVKRLFG